MSLRIVIAGASGFVGRALVRSLAERHDIGALGRRASATAAKDGAVEWRRCDLFSLSETEKGLVGCDTAFYLVHSMQPSERLTQARFEDLDLLLADNFGRAAASSGVRRIIYLGGLVPHEAGAELSTHLASRLEAESALGRHGVPVTAVRAGLVVGAGGSSLRIMTRLVQRLPVMVCPSWTGTRSQPIDLEDVVAILARCAEDAETTGRVCDVGGPDVLTYREMMRETARALGKRRVFVPVPFVTVGLSRLWVSVVTGSPKALVAPLIRSLRHPMVAEDRWLQKRMERPGKPFAESVRGALRAEGRTRTQTARSVQRLPLPARADAEWVAGEYMAWLPRFLRPFVRVELHGLLCRFGVRGYSQPLLELTRTTATSDPTRARFEISGGRLAGSHIGSPRLEFRTTPDGESVLAAIHDYHPSLPWWIYANSQAHLHAFVMWGFRRHLGRIAAGSAEPISTREPASRPTPGTSPSPPA